MSDTVTPWELDHVVEEVTTLPPDHLAIIQVVKGIDANKARALIDQIPEAFRDRIMLLVGHDSVLTVEEAVLEINRQQSQRPLRQVRDAPQA